ncbi:MAG: RNA polymerase sigma factor [Myxococcales bacterium]|nr:RNA polymerase sigma factor [Myxococcales bacterium]
MQDGDAALLRAWQAGDRRAGSALFERHVAAITRFFRSKTDTDIDDLVQDTFLACVRSVDGRPIESFRGFLFGVARHKLLDHIARRARAPFDPTTQSAVAGGASPASALAQRQEHVLLLRALRAIPLDFQITLELFYWEGLSGEDIAVATGVSPHTVRSRLARGRAALEQAVRDLADAPATATTTLSDLDGWARGLAAAL